jgi:enoyl-CoA hydratase/carnithine racemase
MQKMADISFSTHTTPDGRLGRIHLARPRYLNALTHAMIRALAAQLHHWQTQADIEAVIITGAGDRAFCAGGDIRYIYHHAHVPKHNVAQLFWDQYRLNYLIAQFQKPYLACMQGITMGGGVGISVHGSLRVAADNLSLAMPETGIGFFPDIGASYLLPRLKHNFGYYLGLCGTTLTATDALYLGLVDRVVPAQQFALLLPSALEDTTTTQSFAALTQQIDQYACTPKAASPLEHIADDVEHCFSQPTIEAILAALKQCGSDWALRSHAELLKKSPQSLKITLRLLQWGINQQLSTCLQMEYRLASRFIHTFDFMEGIRAAVIDKDKQPQFNPSTIAAVNDETLNEFFKPVSQELHFHSLGEQND